MDRRPRPSRAFTLTELLVVIAILVILAGILVPTLSGMVRASRRSATLADLRKIQTALDAFKADMGEFPLVPARAKWYGESAHNFRQREGGQSLYNAAILNNAALVRALGENSYLPASKSYLVRGGIPSLAVDTFGPREEKVDLDPLDPAAKDCYAPAVFVDAWGNPLLYLHLAAENLGLPSDPPEYRWRGIKEDVRALTTPRYHSRDRDKVKNNPPALYDDKKTGTDDDDAAERRKEYADPDYDTSALENLTTLRAWRNAYGRGRQTRDGNVRMNHKAFAPAWPGMAYPAGPPEGLSGGDREKHDSAAARLLRLSGYPELWSAGPDGRFSFGNHEHAGCGGPCTYVPAGAPAGTVVAKPYCPAAEGSPGRSFHDARARSLTREGKVKAMAAIDDAADVERPYNADNLTISAPWAADREGEMPWE